MVQVLIKVSSAVPSHHCPTYHAPESSQGLLIFSFHHKSGAADTHESFFTWQTIKRKIRKKVKWNFINKFSTDRTSQSGKTHQLWLQTKSLFRTTKPQEKVRAHLSWNSRYKLQRKWFPNQYYSTVLWSFFLCVCVRACVHAIMCIMKQLNIFRYKLVFPPDECSESF